MDQKTRKRLSWTLSILIHSVIAVFVIRASLHYILPEGEVTTTSFEVYQNTPPANQQEAKPAMQPPITDSHTADQSMPVQKPQHTKAAPPHDNVKFLPDKNFNDVQPVDKVDDKNVETTDNSDDQAEAEKPAVDTPPAEPMQPAPPAPPAPKPVAETTPMVAPAAQAPVPETNPISNANNGVGTANTAAPPAYGAPGSMVDETKLIERAGNRNPNYPWVARMKRQEGTVVVRAFIRPDGRVDLPILEKSSGSSLLDEEALKSYASWRYQPGVSGWVSKPFKFSLTGK